MAKEEVVKYRLGWEFDNNQGLVEFATTSGEMLTIPVAAEQFTAITVILQNEKPVYYDAKNNAIYTNPEPIV